MKYFVYWIHLPEHVLEKEGYVGITNNPERRWTDHKYCARRGTHRNSHFQSAINKYSTLLVHEVLLEGTLAACACYENTLRPTEKIGWNLHIGGEHPGMAGRKHTEETKTLLSKLAKERNNISATHNRESWDKISKAMKGSKNHQAKSIICNETGYTFETVTEASKWLGVSSQAVSKHLNNKSKSVKGYTFTYVDMQE